MTNTQANISNRKADRTNNSLRSVNLITSYTPYAEGSVLACMGDTHVLCNASVLEKVPPFLKGQGQGWVTAEYGMLPRATHTRGSREASRGKQSGRTQEIQRLIGRSLRGVFDLQLLGERTIHLDCDVIQADGGTRCASITGAWLAAALAVDQLMKIGVIDKNPIIGQVAAVSVGIVGGQAMLDLDYTEDSSCDTDMNVVMTDTGGFVEIQGTGEGGSFQREELNQLLDLASSGIKELLGKQQQALKASK